MTDRIKVFLIDDHDLFRTGLKYLLEEESSYQFVGEASDGFEGIKKVRQLRPDVVLLDLDMPIMNGCETLAQLLSIQADLVVLMLTVSEHSEDLYESMRLGASGYLLKNISADFLLSSISKAFNGDNVISPEMTSKLINQFKTPEPIVSGKLSIEFKRLTSREQDILKLIAQGKSNKLIAYDLNLAENTVKVHVQNVLRKLNLHSRVQVALLVSETHWI